MFSINDEDLKNYRYLNSGTFGDVYQVNDSTVFKIYKKLILSGEDIYLINPQFYHKESYYRRIINKGKKLKYSDLITDIVYLNGRFGGVALPYYNGGMMLQYKKSSFEDKYRLALELYRNAYELANNHIYPVDYKLSNIMINDGHVKIIDLDDYFTKYTLFPNISHLKESVSLLSQTYVDFFDTTYSYPYTYCVKEKLFSKNWPVYDNFKSLRKELSEFGRKYNYLIISSDADLEEVKKYASRFRFLYQYDKCILNDRYYLNIIDSLRKEGIFLYDFIKDDQIDSFKSNHSIDNMLELKEKFLIKK